MGILGAVVFAAPTTQPPPSFLSPLPFPLPPPPLGVHSGCGRQPAGFFCAPQARAGLWDQSGFEWDRVTPVSLSGARGPDRFRTGPARQPVRFRIGPARQPATEAGQVQFRTGPKTGGGVSAVWFLNGSVRFRTCPLDSAAVWGLSVSKSTGCTLLRSGSELDQGDRFCRCGGVSVRFQT